MSYLFLLLLVLAGCADNCREDQKEEIVKVISCESTVGNNSTCAVELNSGQVVRVLDPKINERVCP